MLSNKINQIVLVLISIDAILAVYTAMTSQVNYFTAVDWGLLSRLPLSYWLGIAVTGIIILLSLRNNSSLNLNLSFVLFVLIIVYTNFLPTIIEKPSGLSSMSLWPSSQANLAILTGHIPVGQPIFLLDYNSWPFFTIFTSIFMQMTGSSLPWLLKWFPLFTITFWDLLVFIILRKFVRSEYALIGVSLFICGSWTKQEYFGPQSFALSLFLLFIYLITKTTNYNFGVRNKQFFALALFTFVALVFFHALTSLAVLILLVAAYIMTNILTKRDVKKTKSNLFFILICASILFAYTVYITPDFLRYSFNQVAHVFGANVAQQITRLSGSEFQQLTNAFTYVIVAAFGSIFLICILLIYRRKKQPNIQIVFWASSIFALLMLALLPYGKEGPFRSFIFMLVFFTLIVVYFVKSKPLILGSFLLILLVASVPAMYGSDSYRLNTGPELQGSKYCAQYLPDGSVVFGDISTSVRYFNPLKNITIRPIGSPPFVGYDIANIEAGLNQTNFIVTSRNLHNYYVYYGGEDLLEQLNLSGNMTLTSARIYDGGNFTVYATNNFVTK